MRLKDKFLPLLAKYDVLSLGIICLFCFITLSYCATTLGISYYEARIFYGNGDIIGHIVRASCSVFGQNDFGMRLPLVIMHIVSIILLYKLSKFYLKYKLDRILSVLLYVLLPGSVASALIINDAGLIILLTLLLLYIFHLRLNFVFYTLFCLLVFVDRSFFVLFLSFFIYAIYKKQAGLAWLSAILIGFSIYLFGFDTYGKPSGHFVDTFGIFAAVFSPFVFLFFVYTIYRIWIKEEKEILWFVSVSAFCFCMVLSIRQKLELTEFLPFCIIATPLIIRTFLASYRIRLPKFRKSHQISAFIAISILIINWFLIIFNPILYVVTKNPENHFVYKFHIAKDIAKQLKNQNIHAVYTTDDRLRLELKFYGISDQGSFELIKNGNDIEIYKYGKRVAGYDLRRRQGI
ncbi:hypothetical protein [Campylobacter majalis]|uniref:hypothetical protein n=1 Tax=Campylobacter majalis TaxID=2790656 RepID=UPI003D683FAA